jgi:hypothetical protein
VQHDRPHIFLGVQEQNTARDVVVTGSIGESMKSIVDADRRAGFCLIFSVNGGCAIASDKDGVESNRSIGHMDARDEIRANSGGKFLTVDDRRAHREVPPVAVVVVVVVVVPVAVVAAAGVIANGGSASRANASS